MERNIKHAANLIKMLANENRLLILCRLIEGPKTVSGLQSSVPGISQSALSQHLKRMRACAMVNSAKSGQNVTYFICDAGIEKVMATLKEQYCQGGEQWQQ